MSVKTKIFIALVIVAGWLDVARSLLLWRSDDLASFLIYFVVAMLVSGWKLQLPGVTGTISVCFVFVLIGIVALSLPEVLITGCSAVLVQYFWQSTKKLRLVQMQFNIASAAIAITASYHVFHSTWLRSLPLEFSVMVALLGCTYFFCTTVLVAAVIALTENQSIRKVWLTCYLWAFPYYLLGAATAGLFVIARRYLGWQTSMLVIPVTYLVYRSYRLYLGRLEDGKKHAEETAALHLRTIESLATAIEAKDHTTHDHLQRVQIYAMELGKELRLNESELEALRAASLLHDIGKIAVPESIINKPGKLTPEEFEKMKVHPVVGAEILERAQFPYPVVPIVRSHHEKWDGSGYPDGLKGEEIPIGARILSAVDCLDALASDRQYRKAMPIDKAMEIVTSEAGKAFDPNVVGILGKRYRELEQQARAQPVEKFSLSTDIKIERGAAPAAGFETSSAPDGQSGDAEARAAFGQLGTLVRSLVGVLSCKEICTVLASRLNERVPFDAMVIYVPLEAKLVPEFIAGNNAQPFSSLKIPMGEGVSGWVAENGRPIINGSPALESSSLPDPTGLRSQLAVPLQCYKKMVGVLSLYRVDADAFKAEHLRVLIALASELAKAVESGMKHREKNRAASMMPTPHMATEATAFEQTLTHA